MQIVIEIPDEEYARIISMDHFKRTYEQDMICDGTPLPKGHGRIGDLDQILLWMIYKKGIIDKLKCGEITPVFKDATIIEADAESEVDEFDNIDSMLEYLWKI